MLLTILFLLFLCLAILDLASTAATRRQAKRSAKRLFATRPNPELSARAGEDHLEILPEALKTYLRISKVLENPNVQTIRMRQKGAIRFKPRQSWMPMEAKCFLTNHAFVGLVWYADVTQSLLCTRTLFHSLVEGHPQWEEKTWGLRIKTGPFNPRFIHQQLLLDYCSTMVWHPDSWLHPGLIWNTLPDGSLQVRISNPDAPLTLTLQFDEQGLLRELSAPLGSKTWIFSYFNYQNMLGIVLPIEWKVEIRESDKTWTHLQAKLTDIAFDSGYAWW